MGKVSNKRSSNNSNHHDNPNRARKNVIRRQHSQNGSQKQPVRKADKNVPEKSRPLQNSQLKPKIPFSKWDQILLVGEGDFTFALSLVQNHEVSSIVATCFDSKDSLEQKYPTVTKTIKRMLPIDQTSEANESTKASDNKTPDDLEEVWTGFSSTDTSEHEETEQKEDATVNAANKTATANIMYGIDATKLSSTHKKALKAYSPFTKIVFNFPHVGGLSTDVNRQVRSNQQLLVDFFNSAKPLLATKSCPAKRIDTTEQDDVEYDSDPNLYEDRTQQDDFLTHGQILVTIFEGEPYTLWNVRDLARHSGLKVLESFKFPWGVYPGYQHARTIGDITNGKDRSDEGKRKGAWRGEERDARCYIFALKDDDGIRPPPGSRKRKKDKDDED